MFEPSLIVAYESFSCPQCEKMNLKIIVILGKGSNTQKCWIFLKISWQFNCKGLMNNYH